jgi:serine/threonine protein kinase
VRGAYTPLYASPEQMTRRKGEPADPRDDVHALGVIWYQLLTGDLEMMSVPPDWRDQVEERGLSRELVKLLGACIASKAAKRPASAIALAEQLQAALSQSPKKGAEMVRKSEPAKSHQQLTPFQRTEPRFQVEIVDAILGAFAYNEENKWLTVQRQKELLRLASEAKFEAMKNWDGGDRDNRMKKHVDLGKAIREGNKYMLAKGVTPAALGVKQAVVDALANAKVISWYDVNGVSHDPPLD